VTRSRRLAATLAVGVLLAACSSGRSASGPPPSQVNAKAVGGGGSGVGPLVVPAPPNGGGPSTAQHVQLHDRQLVIEGVSHSTGPATVMVRVDVAVDNNGGAPVHNAASFFTLISSEGDTFAAEGAPVGFDAAVAVGSTQRGTLQFQVPAAATSGLRLLYRPEVASDAVMVPLPAS
jgi:hypothetical protein